MAVQAAIMNPQFLNFCFPGSMVEYDVEKSLDEGAVLGEAETEEDYKETTRDLLSFIDSASSNIKLALDKPVKSKRKVNHRKYLQKQIKRCTGIIAPSNAAEELPPPPVKRHSSSPPAAQTSGALHSKNLPKRDGAHANLQSKSLAALFSPVQEVKGGERARKPPLRHRNLPPSFFTEPANCARANSAAGTALKDLDRGSAEPVDFFELLGPDYGGMVSEQDLYQSLPVRAAQSEMGGLETLTYDSQHLGGGLLYPAEPKLSNANVVGFCHPDASTVPMEDGSLCTLSFPGFFTDCSVPPVTYDLSGAFSRPNYSSL